MHMKGKIKSVYTIVGLKLTRILRPLMGGLGYCWALILVTIILANCTFDIRQTYLSS